MKKKLFYGAAYYPELWSTKTITEDIRMMKEAKINVVRMAEFSWSTLEPHQDEFNVTFFVEVIENLYRHGIETIICTPTPTPPIWMSHKHTERMIVNERGKAMVHGGRQQVCTNHPFFKQRANIITEKMAKVYGCLPGVIAWQLDNELKGNVSECYCENCNALWHSWLQKKYGAIDVLNEKWGTRIWSQSYEAFDQVPQPFETPAGHNPSLLTAYRSFSRDLAAEFLTEQAEIIKKHSQYPITHNSSLNHFIDNEKSFKSLDFVSFDHYSTSDEYPKMLSWMDAFKTLKSTHPFWIMETAPTYGGSIKGHQTIHQNGYIKAEAAAAYALGAEGFCYWLWRQHRSGFEQTHGHVISSWGKPGVGYKNVVETGILKEKLEEVLSNTQPLQGELAMTYSDRARAFFMAEPMEKDGFDYVGRMMNWYSMILSMGIHRDIIFEHHSFEGYKVLMTPFMPYLSEKYLDRAKKFVEKGGIWIVGPLTGTRTQEHTIHTDHALGHFEQIAGVKTVYHYPVTGSGAVGHAFGIKAPLSLWSTVFSCTDAKIMGVIEEGVTPNMPFITECKRGKGKIVTIGSMPTGSQGREMLKKLVLRYTIEAGITSIIDATTGMLVVPRKGNDLVQWVMINMDGKGGEVTLPMRCKDAFTQEYIQPGKIKIGAYQCKVVEW